MASLITVWARSVTVASCNESCYEAEGSDCHCICGGENHGVGLDQAEINTAISGIQWIAQYVSKSQLDPWSCRAQILGFETSVPSVL